MSATCAFIQDSPTNLQPAILQAILENTYIDDDGVGASSTPELSLLQQEILVSSARVD